MGKPKTSSVWGSNELLGYKVVTDFGKTYNRIVIANKKAKKKGISYGKYMAGLWEEKERTPINKNIEVKPKEEKKPGYVLLTGEEAAEYVRQLKIKAGTIIEEPTAKTKRDTNGHVIAEESKKARILNKEWPAICKMLRPYMKELENVKIAKTKKEVE